MSTELSADELSAFADDNYPGWEEDAREALRDAALNARIMSERVATADAIRADEREQWASYFENAEASVGFVPLTYALAAEMLRGSKPFGVAKGHAR